MLDLTALADDQLQRRVERFLYREAEALDDRDFAAWMAMITSDIDYRMPVRTSRTEPDRMREFSDRAFHMIEDYGSLLTRMKRFETGDAWAETPPSRMRRHVSNVRVTEASGDTIAAKSNLILFWARYDKDIVVSAERRDRLRLVGGELRLAGRTVLLDHVSLPVPNLTVVL